MIGVFFNGVTFSDLTRSLTANSKAQAFLRAQSFAPNTDQQDKLAEQERIALSKSSRLRERSEDLIRKKIGIQNAADDLDSTVRKAQEIRIKLGDMRDLAYSAKNADPDAKALLASEFDNMIDEVADLADDGGSVGRNLIGDVFRTSWLTDTISYYTTQSEGSRRTVQGQYLGSDYRIDLANGNQWVPDLKGTTLSEYSLYPDDIERDVGLGDIAVQSFDRDTGAISFSVEGSETVSGTLERGGVGVLHSWLYGNFQDDASIDTAIEDLDAAITKVDLATLEFKSNEVIARGRARAADRNIENLNDEALQLELDASGARIEIQLAERVRNSIVNQQINGVVSGPYAANLLSSLFDL